MFLAEHSLAQFALTEGAPVGDGALSGTSAFTFTPAATLQGAVPLSGSTSPAFTTTAILRGIGNLSGAIPLTFTTAGTANTGAPTGTINVTFTVTGTLTGTASAIANRPFSFDATGRLSAPYNYTVPATRHRLITTPNTIGP